MDQELAPGDVVADFAWAARALIRQPAVAMISIGAWTLPALACMAALRTRNPITGLIGIVLGVWALGWLGAERQFFRARRQGAKIAVRQLVGSVRSYVGRFVRLSGLVLALMFPVALLSALGFGALIAGGKTGLVPTATRLQGLAMMLAVDLALTFVPSALVFTTGSAREALRIGFRMIRQTWPRSALYVLCPPLALNLVSAMYPTHLPALVVVRAAVLTVLALVAKGATVAFYLRAVPSSHGNESLRGEVSPAGQ